MKATPPSDPLHAVKAAKLKASDLTNKIRRKVNLLIDAVNNQREQLATFATMGPETGTPVSRLQ